MGDGFILYPHKTNEFHLHIYNWLTEKVLVPCRPKENYLIMPTIII